MGQHIQHTLDGKRPARVDPRDAALAMVEVTTLAYTRLGALNSPAYWARPVTFARPSTRDVEVPIYDVMTLTGSSCWTGFAACRSQPAPVCDNGAAREINFEGIVREALGAAQQYFGRFRKGL